MKTKKHQSLTSEIVTKLADDLIDTADRYPLQYLTERDFFPLVYLFLKQHLPTVQAEKRFEHGRIDFRTGGTNPSALELAVAPREFKDANHPDLSFKGHGSKTQLQASANTSELKKLRDAKNVTNRYLVLVDLCGDHNLKKLKADYLKACPRDGSGCAIQVVYRSRTSKPKPFQVGGKQPGRKSVAN
jgi:hypothetical protein